VLAGQQPFSDEREAHRELTHTEVREAGQRFGSVSRHRWSTAKRMDGLRFHLLLGLS
jgi:hypothetical protein